MIPQVVFLSTQSINLGFVMHVQYLNKDANIISDEDKLSSDDVKMVMIQMAYGWHVLLTSQNQSFEKDWRTFEDAWKNYHWSVL